MSAEAVKPALLSASEAAALLNISVTLFQRRVQPRLHAVRIGSRVLFDARDVQDWIDANKRQGNALEDVDPAATDALPVTRARAVSPMARPILARLRG